MGKIDYSKVGDDYSTKDPIKILAQQSAKLTAKNLKKSGFSEISETRGESAYVWKQGDIYMASVIEGLGTKNVIADELRKVTGKTYYDVIAHDTVATIINDLVSTGATPLVLHAYWAIGHNSWLLDKKRSRSLILGWKKACNIACVSWGGGETPTLQGVMKQEAIELGGSAVGIITSKQRLLLGTKLNAGDNIIFVKSNGINANGLSLARSLFAHLPNGYKTKMASGRYLGEAILQKSNIYSALVKNLLDEKVEIHYISNLTGHGLRKVMRANAKFTYLIEDLFKPQEFFRVIQKEAKMSDEEAYATFNMGQDYAIFLPEREVNKCLALIKACGFKAIVAGHIKKGERQVILKPKNIIYKGKSLTLR